MRIFEMMITTETTTSGRQGASSAVANWLLISKSPTNEAPSNDKIKVLISNLHLTRTSEGHGNSGTFALFSSFQPSHPFRDEAEVVEDYQPMNVSCVSASRRCFQDWKEWNRLRVTFVDLLTNLLSISSSFCAPSVIWSCLLRSGLPIERV